MITKTDILLLYGYIDLAIKNGYIDGKSRITQKGKMWFWLSKFSRYLNEEKILYILRVLKIGDLLEAHAYKVLILKMQDQYRWKINKGIKKVL